MHNKHIIIHYTIINDNIIIKLLENNWKKSGDFHCCNSKTYTCTPNVSPHVSVRTVVHLHVNVYEKHMRLASEIRC